MDKTAWIGVVIIILLALAVASVLNFISDNEWLTAFIAYIIATGIALYAWYKDKDE